MNLKSEEAFPVYPASEDHKGRLDGAGVNQIRLDGPCEDENVSEDGKEGSIGEDGKKKDEKEENLTPEEKEKVCFHFITN